MNRKERRARQRPASSTGRPARTADLLAQASAEYAAGQRHKAATLLAKAVRLDPTAADVASNLAVVLEQSGRPGEALAACRRAVTVAPATAAAYYNMGISLSTMGRQKEAASAYRRAIALDPFDAGAFANLGAVLSDIGDFDAAADACRRAIDNGLPEAYHYLGAAYHDLDMPGPALGCCDRALAVKPDCPEALYNRGNALQAQGRTAEAIASYRRALGLKPDFSQARSNLLMSLSYSPDHGAADLFAEARSFAHPLKARISTRNFPNTPDPHRRLRIGYLSPDFRQHSVGYFLLPVLAAHDRSVTEIFCYANTVRTDGVTEQFRQAADRWRTIVNVTDDGVAERIVEDGIDILVDLAGHTAQNRLGVFARRPAPVQVTWLGYPGTTGLAAIDYRLVDPVTDPERDGNDDASERLYRLKNGFLCYAPPADAPEPKARPETTDPVTFGSFNNPAKLSSATVALWAKLMARTPGSRLLLKGRTFTDPSTRALFLERFAEFGIDPGRITLKEQQASTASHLDFYGEVDIGLDPIPYNGTTTTCEALWMGVPVIALRGNRHSARVGASLLTRIGLADLIAEDEDDYVRIAVALASDAGRRRDLCRALRPRMAASPLCDSKTFTNDLENAFRDMWRQWCETVASKESTGQSDES